MKASKVAAGIWVTLLTVALGVLFFAIILGQDKPPTHPANAHSFLVSTTTQIWGSEADPLDSAAQVHINISGTDVLKMKETFETLGFDDNAYQALVNTPSDHAGSAVSDLYDASWYKSSEFNEIWMNFFVK